MRLGHLSFDVFGLGYKGRFNPPCSARWEGVKGFCEFRGAGSPKGGVWSKSNFGEHGSQEREQRSEKGSSSMLMCRSVSARDAFPTGTMRLKSTAGKG